MDEELGPEVNGQDVYSGYFCHSCEKEVCVHLDAAGEEFECAECGSECVEAPDQDLEGFIEPSVPMLSPIMSSSSSSSSGGTDDLVRSLLRRALTDNDGQVRGHLDTGINNLLLRQLHGAPSTQGDIAGFISDLLGVPSTRGQDEGNIDDVLHAILMNETSYASTPASSDAITRLKRTVCDPGVDLVEFGECGITQEEFEEGDTVVTLDCGHHYKEASIMQWLRQSNTCPFCRLVVS